MIIRRATENDLKELNRLLYQVMEVHSQGRPDIFRQGEKKSSDEELKTILNDYKRPIFVADEGETGLSGYVFCVIEENRGSRILNKIKTLYIDDLCVDKELRHRNIGRRLLEYAVNFAKAEKCRSVTLNVWAFNGNAIKFYEACGFTPQKITMEKLI